MITARTARRYALWSLFAITLSAASIFLWMRLQTVGSRGPALQFVSPSLSNGWVPFGGDWKSQGKTILNDSEDRGPKLMNGSLKWKNYFIEADIKLLGPYGDAGLIIRSSGEERGVDSYHGYFAGIRNMDNSFIFGRADFGWDQYIVKRIFPGVRGWYHIKLLAYGCSLAASVTNETGLIVRSYVNDPHCIHEGRFGLKSYDTSAEWRNVRIGPSTLNQLQKLTRGMTPAVVNSNLNEVDSGLTAKALDQYIDPIRREAAMHKFDLDVQSIGSLDLDRSDNPMPVTVRGIVTLVHPALYLQDSSGAVLVQPLHLPVPVRVGEEVEAHGLLSEHDYSPVLGRASLKVLWPNSPVPPLAVTPFELAVGRNRGKFVEVEGKFLSEAGAPGGPNVLILVNGSQEFYAIDSRQDFQSRTIHLRSGSQLRLRGVATSDAKFTRDLVPFALLIPPSGGIQVIGQPPWWTPEHVALIVGVLLLLAAAIHLLLSKIQHWRYQAILNERERIALEMHDTLAQSFAGIAFQLQAMRDEVPPDQPIRRQVEVALDMVRRSHIEAKRSMTAIKPGFSVENFDIAESLRRVAARLSHGSSVVVQASCHGPVRRIPPHIADTLFLIGQESISNSLRHAAPSQIDIDVDIKKHEVQLSLRDNGVGFVVDENNYGMGLRGMKRRAAQLSSCLELSSSPGMGTELVVRVRLVQPFHLWRRVRSLREITFASKDLL